MPEALRINERLSYLRRISFKKLAAYTAIPAFYVFLPLHAAFHFLARPLVSLSLFYLANFLLFFFLCRWSVRSSSAVRFECEDLEGRKNLQAAQNAALELRNSSLSGNIRRYASLKAVIEGLNQEPDPHLVCERLCVDAFTLVAKERGTCILYVADPASRCLRLRVTRKEDHKLIIKAKQGDIFDQWVLMRLNPLLIEDIGNDFRFDSDRISSLDDRRVGSLISCPLISGTNFIGILRIDNPAANTYSLDDLRFLRSISDLGALALENAMLYRNMQELAIHDGLTGACTKGYFQEMLALECKRSLRGKKRFGLLMVDIDHFKRYNDSYGHIAGDIVLKSIVEKMTALLKDQGAVIGRFGGEEFSVILPGEDPARAMETAERLRRAIAGESFTLRRKTTGVTVSIGCAGFPENGDEALELLMKADKALYDAKQSGRDKVARA